MCETSVMKHARLKQKNHPPAKHHHYNRTVTEITLFFFFFVSSRHRRVWWRPSGGASVAAPPTLSRERRAQCLPNEHLFFSSKSILKARLNVINRIPWIQRRPKKVAIPEPMERRRARARQDYRSEMKESRGTPASRESSGRSLKCKIMQFHKGKNMNPLVQKIKRNIFKMPTERRVMMDYRQSGGWRVKSSVSSIKLTASTAVWRIDKLAEVFA